MSKKKKIMLVIAVLLVIGLGVGAFLYLRKKEEETGRPEADATSRSGAPVIPLQPVAFSREEQIRQLYEEILGRQADASGLAYWTASPASIDEIRQAFYASDEYRQKLAR